MPTELRILALAGLLQIVQFVLMAVPVNLQLGVAWTGGPRDEPRHIDGIAGRLKRAFDNHFEALIMFTLAVIVVTLGDRTGPFTAGCAWIYLAARVLYIPAYVSGIPLLRSAIWFVGFLATAAMIVAALL
jgi:uncharacterized MAPEG superfamily protein